MSAWEAACGVCGASRPWPTSQRPGSDGATSDAAATLCVCGGVLSLRVPLGPRTRAALLATLAGGDATHWRYAPLLPAPPPTTHRLPVGGTPLIDCGTVSGVRLLVKDETRNPSGSLKDRASDVVVAAATARGVRGFVAASTGNAAASLACIGAGAGVAVVILVPAGAPPAKLAQIRAHGAQVFPVAGSYDEAWDLAALVAQHTGLHNRSTAINPVTREGKKTCALEIAEQLGWRVPDWVIVPSGDGNILSALWKGFRELHALGLTDGLPRLVAAQAAASDALTRAHAEAGGARLGGGTPGATLADSIAVARPRDAAAALAALSASRGWAVAVEEGELIAGVRALASRYGLFVEPSSAAAHAAFERLMAAGVFDVGQRVVCLATGHGLKDVRPVLMAGADDPVPSPVAPGDWRAVADAVTAHPVAAPVVARGAPMAAGG